MKKWNSYEGQRQHRRQRPSRRHGSTRGNRQSSTYNHPGFGTNERDASYRGSQRRFGSESSSGSLSQSSSSSTSSSSSSSGAQSSAPELPGFYFDPEKNRYFRLLPGHNNCNPLTREKLQAKEREKERQEMLAKDENPNKKTPRKGLNASLLLQKRHLGLLPFNSYSRFIHEVKASGMKRHKVKFQSTHVNLNLNTDTFRNIVGDSACERVFTVHDDHHGRCKYSIMNFGRSRGPLSVEMGDIVHCTNQKVNSMCWASVRYPDSHVLLCQEGMAELPGSVSLLPFSLFSDSCPAQPGVMFNFKLTSAWSCAWCLHPQFDKRFSTGLSRRVIINDAVTEETQTYDVSSDVLAQQFATKAPVLFNGCRSGEIFSVDLRQPSRGDQNWKAKRFHQESAITCIRFLQDENYLLAADMLGQIKMWDVRGTKPVQEYKGHNNQYAYLPIHVSEPEGLLLAVGQDCHTRLWSLRDGHLLRTIPSPHPAANDSIPSIVFSSNLGGSRTGLPGLLMAVRTDLFYYPYNAHDQDLEEPVTGFDIS